ncbi:MAG: MoaD/ThiS family protein [Sphingomonadales bacterium]|nr:MoaD/ThiS family protein [Sphingomonadaceae bacterium]MBS3929959.1 MoaD/ThiS family protein [Sphingomonadales bacterium]
MSARLVFLGRLEDLAGAGECEVPAGPLEAVLAALEPDLAVALLGERVRIALNGALLANRGGIVLGEGDELAFLPPVSGG